MSLPRWLLRLLGQRWFDRPAGARREGYCYLGQGRALARTHRGHAILLDTADHWIAPHIASSGVWEWEVECVLQRLLRPGAVVAEIGANFGYHTLHMAQRIGAQGVLHAFEAHPQLMPLLRASIAMNGYADRVTLHGAAALDAAGEVALAVDAGNLGSGFCVPPGGSTAGASHIVPATTLDAALHALPRLDLLRMDAEGSEPLVLRGAAALLARSPELVMVTEWSPPMLRARAELPVLVDWLSGQGFRFWRIGDKARLEAVAPPALPDLPHSDLVVSRSMPGPLR